MEHNCIIYLEEEGYAKIEQKTEKQRKAKDNVVLGPHGKSIQKESVVNQEEIAKIESSTHTVLTEINYWKVC